MNLSLPPLWPVHWIQDTLSDLIFLWALRGWSQRLAYSYDVTFKSQGFSEEWKGTMERAEKAAVTAPGSAVLSLCPPNPY